MKIGEGLVFGGAVALAVAAGGCSAEQPAPPTPTPSPETIVIPTPTSPDQCPFGIGDVALRDKPTKTLEITSLYAGKVAPGDVCEPKPDSEASVSDLHNVFSPEEETNQRVRVGSLIVATCMSVTPSYLGIETTPGRKDAVSFYPGGGVQAEVTSALGGPLPDCFAEPTPPKTN